MGIVSKTGLLCDKSDCKSRYFLCVTDKQVLVDHCRRMGWKVDYVESVEVLTKAICPSCQKKEETK